MSDLTDTVNVSEHENVEETEVENGEGIATAEGNLDEIIVTDGAEDNVIVDVDSPDVNVNVQIDVPETENDSDSSTDLAVLRDMVLAEIRAELAIIRGEIAAVGSIAFSAAETAEDIAAEEAVEEIVEEIEADEPPESARPHWFFR